MRYISPYSNLQIMKTDGTKKYQFDNGVLLVGSSTTHGGANNSFVTTDVMQIFAADLAGGTDQTQELCGMGSLNSLDVDGDAVATGNNGLRGFFFPAPVLTGTTNTVVATAGVWYEVLSGTVTYAGTTYSAGRKFAADGTTTATTGSGTFALTWAPDECSGFLDEQFKIKHLIYGDEPEDYFLWQDGGFDPREAQAVGTIGTGYGFIR